MPAEPQAAWDRRWPSLLAALAILAIAAAALLLRLRDPLSDPVVAAEDPFTHLALAREHLADGRIDPLYPGGTVYPPGFHALIAAISVTTGASLLDLARVLPPLLGTLGVLGVALLAWRHWGPWPAVAASLCLALLPEAVFRSSMLSPTALDLALLPFLAYAILEVVAGRWAWTWAVAALLAFEAFAHPWVFGVLAAAGGAGLLLWLLRRDARGDEAHHAGGAAAAVALVGLGLAVSMQGCWGSCGPGFDSVIGVPFVDSVEGLAGLVAVAAVLPLAAWLAWRWRQRTAPGPRPVRPTRAWRRFALAGAHAAALSVVAWRVAASGLPEHVGMASIGWPILALGCAGLLASPWAKAPLSLLAAGLFWGTLPFVVFNPLDSPFWPHRTMVYLGLAMALLAGAAVHVLLRACAQASQRMSWPRPARWSAVAAAGLLLASGLGAVAAQTPAPYAWYRLFDPCEDAALRKVATLAAAEPDALVVSGSWQSKLVVAASAPDASRVWYSPGFFRSGEGRDGTMKAALREGRQVYAVVDRFLPVESPGHDLGFLGQAPWEPALSACGEARRVEVHRVGLQPRFEPRGMGNAWWVEVDVLAPRPVQEAQWSDGGEWRPLERTEWGSWAWQGRVADNATLVFRATIDGAWATSAPVAWS